MTTSYEQDVPLDAVSQYMRWAKSLPRLTDEEEAQLLLHIESSGKQVSEDTERARARLIEGYQPLTIALAKRYAWRCKELSILDLVQEGNLGLLQALACYDRAKSNTTFGVWAFPWVRRLIFQALREQEGSIRIPRRKAQALIQLEVVEAQLMASFGRQVTVQELAQGMDLSIEQVQELILLQAQKTIGLYSAIGEDDDLLLEDTIPAPDVAFDDDKYIVEDLLDRLPSQERAMIELKYGILDEEPRTSQEIANLLGVARSKVEEVDWRFKKQLHNELSRDSA